MKTFIIIMIVGLLMDAGKAIHISNNYDAHKPKKSTMWVYDGVFIINLVLAVWGLYLLSK